MSNRFQNSGVMMTTRVARNCLAFASIALQFASVGTLSAAENTVAQSTESAAIAELRAARVALTRVDQTAAALMSLATRGHASPLELLEAGRARAKASAYVDVCTLWSLAVRGEQDSVHALEPSAIAEVVDQVRQSDATISLDALRALRRALAADLTRACAQADAEFYAAQIASLQVVDSQFRRPEELAGLISEEAASRARRNAAATTVDAQLAEIRNALSVAEPKKTELTWTTGWIPDSFKVAGIGIELEAGLETHPRRQRSIASIRYPSRTTNDRSRSNADKSTPVERTASQPLTSSRVPLGQTYSSGYAFGQLRRDLPPAIRLPRADSLGGPWYLPGSPTNELRIRRRALGTR